MSGREEEHVSIQCESMWQEVEMQGRKLSH